MQVGRSGIMSDVSGRVSGDEKDLCCWSRRGRDEEEEEDRLFAAWLLWRQLFVFVTVLFCFFFLLLLTLSLLALPRRRSRAFLRVFGNFCFSLRRVLRQSSEQLRCSFWDSGGVEQALEEEDKDDVLMESSELLRFNRTSGGFIDSG